MIPLVIALHLFSTFFMTGVIWFVQIVHYPLFLVVPDSVRPLYAKKHAKRTGWVVVPVMLIELITGMILYFKNPDYVIWGIGAILLLGIWWVTFKQLVPLHGALAESGDPIKAAALTKRNLIRTIFWSLRSLLILTWLFFRLKY